jgi:uncharacterized protein
MSTHKRPTELSSLEAALEHARELLPAQKPIERFVHHNTLHAFEHMPFEKAVISAGKLYGAEPFMSENEYRKAYRSGRILEQDIDIVLERHVPANPLFPELSERDLAKGLLLYSIDELGGDRLTWVLEETSVLQHFRTDVPSTSRTKTLRGIRKHEEAESLRSLYQTCCEHTRSISWPKPESQSLRIPASMLRDRTGMELNDIIHPLLIRWCGAFLDHGVSFWSMPDREQGFFHAFLAQVASNPHPGRPWTQLLKTMVEKEELNKFSSKDCVVWLLNRLSIPESEWNVVVTQTLLALPGWAGQFHMLETNPSDAPGHVGDIHLVDFLAVRLLLDVVVVTWFSQLENHPQSPTHAQTNADSDDPSVAYVLFQMAQIFGWSISDIKGMDTKQISQLFSGYIAFESMQRRMLWHLAYERRYFVEIMDATLVHSHHAGSEPSSVPLAQVVCCIDDREESLRRHLEEIEPNIETFGAAGFYGIAMQYQGVDDPTAAPLCPANMKPKHWIREVRVDDHGTSLPPQIPVTGKLSAAWAAASHTLLRGSLVALSGISALAPMVSSVIAPRAHGQLREKRYTAMTRLLLERENDDLKNDLYPGYSIPEMIAIVAGILRGIGLTRRFANLVLILGHGSHSANNPHFAAYNCGACAGGRGGPNGRAFAWMANDKRVRKGLELQGIKIPHHTWFVGGYHDTANDELTLYDKDVIPADLMSQLRAVTKHLEEARRRDAHERCRSFASASLDLDGEHALKHAEARAHDLAQARPELGHARNALCIVGRRSLTRGLFLDRRAFLTSYDPSIDPDVAILTNLMSAVGPVCAGINLEYYFSFVDPVRYGAGTKLPHNITGLIGVMDGHSSDLRTGLPWQMVEIHEPVRLLTIIESTPERVQKVMDNLPNVARLITNGWIRLATLDPATHTIHYYRDGKFEKHVPESTSLPKVDLSKEWYTGHREPLGPVEITAVNANKEKAA